MGGIGVLRHTSLFFSELHEWIQHICRGGLNTPTLPIEWIIVSTTMHCLVRLPILLFLPLDGNTMPASTSMAAAAGHYVSIILLFASTLTPQVQALQEAPSAIAPHRNLPRPLHCLPSTAPLGCSRSPLDPVSSSSLFGIKRRRKNFDQKIYALGGGGFGRNSRSALHSSTRDGSGAVDAEVTPTKSSSSASLLRAVDNFGMKLKPWALSAYNKSVEYYSKIDVNGTLGFTDLNTTDATTSSGSVNATISGSVNANRTKSILCRVQANILWILYIIYRGYRGFFVILPAVFREVYRQLEESDLVVDVYGDEEEDEKDYAVNDQQEKEPMRLRTRITISVLSGILTLSYVVSGLMLVLGEMFAVFVRTDYNHSTSA